ncbi:MAG: sugar phosphate isomerase/epimerase [Chloroflexi bacterium]|nr:sugar phosphate isomerase/epimerase [Chloroflexota bacterium]MCI0856501.1 sugar phosphate isomerase/epimerase [Chloroflexota bacterium]MCI0890904.1 sugar phosphate isomerase/epimerase [Chloroflexota bacterium]
MTSNSELKISLAAWSLHREFFDKTIDQLGMLDACAEFGITGFELVNTFFPSPQYAYLRHMKKRAGDAGIELLLIMCDGEGDLAHVDKAKREVAARSHRKWIDIAGVLECQSIRVNIRGEEDDPDAMRERAAEGLRMVLDYASGTGISVLLENHGGLSSDPVWLTSLVDLVDDPQLGTLPDFGNFPDETDRYQAVETLMPQAKAVSAKCYDFDTDNNETKIDFPRMMEIVKAAGYSGYVGIEYEGQDMPERDGIRACKTLLERLI